MFTCTCSPIPTATALRSVGAASAACCTSTTTRSASPGELDVPAVFRVVRYICAAPTCERDVADPAGLPRALPVAGLADRRARRGPGAAAAGRPGAVPARSPASGGERASARRQSSSSCFSTTAAARCWRRSPKAPASTLTRRCLVDIHAHRAGTPPWRRLADLAALVDRLERGYVSCERGRCRVPVGRRDALVRSHRLWPKLPATQGPWTTRRNAQSRCGASVCSGRS